jgi:hypothetical protein
VYKNEVGKYGESPGQSSWPICPDLSKQIAHSCQSGVPVVQNVAIYLGQSEVGHETPVPREAGRRQDDAFAH